MGLSSVFVTKLLCALGQAFINAEVERISEEEFEDRFGSGTRQIRYLSVGEDGEPWERERTVERTLSRISASPSPEQDGVTFSFFNLVVFLLIGQDKNNFDKVQLKLLLNSRS